MGEGVEEFLGFLHRQEMTNNARPVILSSSTNLLRKALFFLENGWDEDEAIHERYRWYTGWEGVDSEGRDRFFDHPNVRVGELPLSTGLLSSYFAARIINLKAHPTLSESPLCIFL